MSDKVLDLFCGAGGLSLGFELAGCNVIGGIDISQVAIKTFVKNHAGKGINLDLSVPANLNHLENLDFNPGKIQGVIGGPPCQGFSDARGKRDIKNSKNNLVTNFIEWVEVIKPNFVVMENVPGIQTIANGKFFQEIKQKFLDMGFFVQSQIINMGQFGVPQKRERMILVGIKGNYSGISLFPEPERIVHDEMRGTAVPRSETISAKDAQSLVSKHKRYTPVSEALHGLQEEANSEKITNTTVSWNSEYLEFVTKGKKIKQTTLHLAKQVKYSDLKIISKLAPGQTYRSNRFGTRYVGVWKIYNDSFTKGQSEALQYIGKNQGTKSKTLEKKHGEGHIPLEDICTEVNVTKTMMEELENTGWVKKLVHKNLTGYKLTTKAGIRPRFTRLNFEWLSPTILTTDFNAREKLHPSLPRGISLREGARIQTFPDDFHFAGNFSEVSEQIGNAVPPLFGFKLAKHISKAVTKKLKPSLIHNYF